MYYRDTKNNCVYRDGGVKLTTRESYLGFSGTCWRITLADGTQIVSNNLWMEWAPEIVAQAQPVTLEHISRRELVESLGKCGRCEGTGRHGRGACPECNAAVLSA